MPLRRMILQLRQIFLTEPETLLFALLTLSVALLGAEHDTSPRQVVGRQLHGDLVTWEDADVVHPHLSRNMSEHYVPVFQLHAKRCIREVFEHLPLHLD